MPINTNLLEEALAKLTKGTVGALATQQKPISVTPPQAQDTASKINKQASNLEQRMTQANVSPEQFTDTRNPLEKALNLPENQNWLFDIFDVLGRPQQAVFNALKAAQEGRTLENENAFIKGLTGEAKKVYFGEILRGPNNTRPEGTVDWTDILGFAGDVFLDPADLAFIPAKVVAKGVKTIGGLASKADDVLDGMKAAVDSYQAAEEIAKATGAVTDDIAKAAAKLNLDPQAYADMLARNASKIDLDWSKTHRTLAPSARKVSTLVDYAKGQELLNAVEEGIVQVDEAAAYVKRLVGIEAAANNSVRMMSRARYLANGMDTAIDDVAETLMKTNSYIEGLDEVAKQGYFRSLGKNYKLVKGGEKYVSPTDLVIRSLWGSARTTGQVTGELTQEAAKFLGVGDQLSQIERLIKSTFAAGGGLPKGLLREAKEAFGKEAFTKLYADEKMSVIRGITKDIATKMGADEEEIGRKLNQIYSLKNLSGQTKMQAYDILTGGNIFPYRFDVYNKLAQFISVPKGKTMADLLPIMEKDGRKWIDLTQLPHSALKRLKDLDYGELVDVPRILSDAQVEELNKFFDENPAFQEGYKEFEMHWGDMLNKMSDYLGIDYRSPGAYVRNAITADFELKKAIEAQNKLDQQSAEKLGKSTFRGNPRAFKKKVYNVGTQEANIWSNANLAAKEKNKIVDAAEDLLKFNPASEVARTLGKEYDNGSGIFTYAVRRVLSAMAETNFKPIKEKVISEVGNKFDTAQAAGDIKVEPGVTPFYSFTRNGVKATRLQEILADDEINELVWLKKEGTEDQIKAFIKKFGQEEFDLIPADYLEIPVEETTGRVLNDDFKKIFEDIQAQPEAPDLTNLTYSQKKVYETMTAQEQKQISRIVDDIVNKNEPWSQGYTRDELNNIVSQRISSEGSRKYLASVQPTTKALEEGIPYKVEDAEAFGSHPVSKEILEAKTVEDKISALRKIETDETIPESIRKDYIENIKPKLDEYDAANKAYTAQETGVVTPKANMTLGKDPISLTKDDMYYVDRLIRNQGLSYSKVKRLGLSEFFRSDNLNKTFGKKEIGFLKEQIEAIDPDQFLKRSILNGTGDYIVANPVGIANELEFYYAVLKKLDDAYGTDLSKTGIFKHYDVYKSGKLPVLEKGDVILGLNKYEKNELNRLLNVNFVRKEKRLPLKRFTDELDNKIKDMLRTEFADDIDDISKSGFNLVYNDRQIVDGRLMGWSSKVSPTWLERSGLELVKEGDKQVIKVVDLEKAKTAFDVVQLRRNMLALDRVLGTNYAHEGILGEIFGKAPEKVSEVVDVVPEAATKVTEEVPSEFVKPKEWYQTATKAQLSKEIGRKEAEISEIITKRIKKMPDTRPILKTVHWDPEAKKMIWTDSFRMFRINKDIPFLPHSTEVPGNYPQTARLIPTSFSGSSGIDVEKLNKIVNTPEQIEGLWEALDREGLLSELSLKEQSILENGTESAANGIKRKYIKEALGMHNEKELLVPVYFGGNMVSAQYLKDAVDVIGNPGEVRFTGELKPMYMESPIGDALILPMRVREDGVETAKTRIIDEFLDVSKPTYTAVTPKFNEVPKNIALEKAPAKVVSEPVVEQVAKAAEAPVEKVAKPKMPTEVTEFISKTRATKAYADKLAKRVTKAGADADVAARKVEDIVFSTKQRYEKSAAKLQKEEAKDIARQEWANKRINVPNAELKGGNFDEIVKRLSPEDKARYDELTKKGQEKVKAAVDQMQAEGRFVNFTDVDKTGKEYYVEAVKKLEDTYVRSAQRSFLHNRVIVDYTEEELKNMRVNQIAEMLKGIRSNRINNLKLSGTLEAFQIKTDAQKEVLKQLLVDAGVPQSKINAIMQDEVIENNVNAYLAGFQAHNMDKLDEVHQKGVDFVNMMWDEHKTFNEEINYSIADYAEKFAREGRNAKIYKAAFSHITLGDIGDPNSLVRFLPRGDVFDVLEGETQEDALRRFSQLSPRDRFRESQRILPRGYKIIENPRALVAKMSAANKLVQDESVENAIKWISAHLDPEQGSIIMESNLARLLMLDTKEGANGLLELIDFTNNLFKRFKLLTPGFNIRNVMGIFTNAWLGAIEFKEMPGLLSKANQVFTEGPQLLKLNAVLSPQQWADEVTEEQKQLFNIYKTFIEGQFSIPVSFKEFRTRGLSGTASELQDLARKTLDDQGSESIETILDMEKKSKAAAMFEKPLKVIDVASLANGWGNETVDAYGRMMVMLKAMDPELGADYMRVLDVGSPIEAVRLVMFDPKNISQTESDVVRRVIPFYAFTKMNLAYHMRNIENNPSRYYRMIKAVRKSWQLAGIKEEDIDPYKLDQMYLPLPGATKDGKYYAIKANLPVSDLIEFVSDPLKRVLGSMAPYIKAPFEMAANTSIFTGQPIERFKGEKSKTLPFLDKKTEYILGQTGLDAPLRVATSLATGNVGAATGMLAEGNTYNTRMAEAYDKLTKLQDGVKFLKQKNVTLPDLIKKDQVSIQEPKLDEAQRILRDLLKTK